MACVRLLQSTLASPTGWTPACRARTPSMRAPTRCAVDKERRSHTIRTSPPLLDPAGPDHPLRLLIHPLHPESRPLHRQCQHRRRRLNHRRHQIRVHHLQSLRRLPRHRTRRSTVSGRCPRTCAETRFQTGSTLLEPPRLQGVSLTGALAWQTQPRFLERRSTCAPAERSPAQAGVEKRGGRRTFHGAEAPGTVAGGSNPPVTALVLPLDGIEDGMLQRPPALAVLPSIFAPAPLRPRYSL